MGVLVSLDFQFLPLLSLLFFEFFILPFLRYGQPGQVEVTLGGLCFSELHIVPHQTVDNLLQKVSGWIDFILN